MVKKIKNGLFYHKVFYFLMYGINIYYYFIQLMDKIHNENDRTLLQNLQDYLFNKNTPFDKCNFNATELNHDWNSERAKAGLGFPISVKLQQLPQVKETLATNLSTGSQGCDTFNFQQHPVLNDEKIVQKIIYTMQLNDDGSPILVNMDKQSLVKLTSYQPSKKNHICAVLVNDINDKTTAKYSPVIFRKFEQTQKKNKEFKDIFFENSHPTDTEYQDDIFLSIDVDRVGFIKNLNERVWGPQKPRIHCMYSNVVLADGAKKNDSSPLCKDKKNISAYAWYLNQNQTIPMNESLFMSAYEVENIRAAPDDPRIVQKWKLNDQDIYTVPDARNENNVEKLASIVKGRNFFSDANSTNDTSDDNKKFVSWLLQRKRSGDYFQIWFTKYLPKKFYDDVISISNNPPNSSIFLLKNIPHNVRQEFFTSPTYHFRSTNQPLPDKNTIMDYYRKRTYFVTGDWPAFCYALYNQVNCIYADEVILSAYFPYVV